MLSAVTDHGETEMEGNSFKGSQVLIHNITLNPKLRTIFLVKVTGSH